VLLAEQFPLGEQSKPRRCRSDSARLGFDPVGQHGACS